MEDLHREFDRATTTVQSRFGATHPMFINGRPAVSADQFEDRSPIDIRVLLGRFQKGTREQVREAIAAARAAFAMWNRVPWEERVHQVRRIGQAIHERRAELGALIGWETGKNRLESVGEGEACSPSSRPSIFRSRSRRDPPPRPCSPATRSCSSRPPTRPTPA